MQFHQGFSYDNVALFLGMLISFLGHLRHVFREATFSSHLVLSLTWSLVQSTLLLSLLYLRRATYYKHREAILGANIVSRALVYYFFTMKAPAFLSVHPLQLPASPLQAAMHLLTLPAMTLRILVTFITTSNTSRANALAILLLHWFHSLTRCELELERIPGQGQRYQQIISTIEEYSFQYFPLPPSLSSHSGSSGLDE